MNIGSGTGSRKYGMVQMEDIFLSYLGSSTPLIEIYHRLIDPERIPYSGYDSSEKKFLFVGTYFHEFAHTVELNFPWDEVYNYHDALGVFNDGIGYYTTKLYLLNQLEVNGEKVGIPEAYWRHETKVNVNYVPQVENNLNGGKIFIVNEESEVESWKNYITRDVPYGSNLIVEAVANDGFTFIGWSDGVKTAQRTDTNIISYLNVRAIFEKIN